MDEAVQLSGKAAREHFERVGRALAATHMSESPPQRFAEVVRRMLAIDPECGMGTDDPLGGDWQSHLAYIRNRQMLTQRSRSKRGPSG